MSLDQLHLLPPAQQEAILNGPALAPPAGIVPNLENPPNSNTLGLAVETFLFTLSTVAAILAAYVKIFVTKRRHLEDYLAFSAYALYAADVATVYRVICGVGIFVHQWNVRVKDLASILYEVHIGSELYAAMMPLIKAAILLEWVRIFVPRGTRSTFYWTCHIFIWVNLSFYTAILIWGNTSCKPYEKLWDKTLPGTCLKGDAFDIVTASYNGVSDILILLLPQRVIWKLRLNRKKKLGIALVFAVGLSACIAAAYRLYASVRYLLSYDVTYGVGGIGLGSSAEQTCAILIYCVPNIPRLFKEKKTRFVYLNRLFSRFRYANKPTTADCDQSWDTIRKVSCPASYQHIIENADLEQFPIYKPEPIFARPALQSPNNSQMIALTTEIYLEQMPRLVVAMPEATYSYHADNQS
ncbi:hypothetical protein F5Y07DRAFT_369840 [Xylaria sp. FL0933]|nr:hypothetical protein F5Y07DRAFT_369840 [Xylaria sp. FL0933]